VTATVRGNDAKTSHPKQRGERRWVKDGLTQRFRSLTQPATTWTMTMTVNNHPSPPPGQEHHVTPKLRRDDIANTTGTRERGPHRPKTSKGRVIQGTPGVVFVCCFHPFVEYKRVASWLRRLSFLFITNDECAITARFSRSVGISSAHVCSPSLPF